MRLSFVALFGVLCSTTVSAEKPEPLSQGELKKKLRAAYSETVRQLAHTSDETKADCTSSVACMAHRAGLADEAKKLAKQSMALFNKVNDPTDRDFQGITLAGDLYGMGQTATADSVVAKIGNRRLILDAYEHGISHLACDRNSDQAKDLADRAIKVYESLGPEDRIRAVATVASCLAAVGQAEKARDIVLRTGDDACQMEALAWIAFWQATLDNPKGARKTLAEAAECLTRVKESVKEHVEAERKIDKDALEIHEKTDNENKGDKSEYTADEETIDRTLSLLVYPYCKTGGLEIAARLLEEIEDAEWRVLAMADFASQLSLLGRRDQATAKFKEAEKLLVNEGDGDFLGWESLANARVSGRHEHDFKQWLEARKDPEEKFFALLGAGYGYVDRICELQYKLDRP